MRLLFLGDIVGNSGRQMVKDHLPRLRRELELDVILANGENASGGLGLSAKSAQELHRCGVDVLTTGNHVWKFPDIRPALHNEPWLLRPANYPASAPGRGAGVYELGVNLPPLMVINLQGRIFMEAIDCPFTVAESLVAQAPPEAVVLVDIHAEATSEKRALAHMLRGRVQAVVGTHTHVQTNDACIFDGTGYISDLGMCGPEDSCLGMDSDIILRRFRTGLPQRFELAKGPCMLNGALMEVVDGQCREITAWQYRAS
jgi:metallophosphoesterase (TIGR00282 family)